MITNKDIRVENGFLIINGDKFPLDGQSPETIMEIVEDNSDTTPTENSTAPITSGGVFAADKDISDTIGDITQTGITGASVAAQLAKLGETKVGDITVDSAQTGATKATSVRQYGNVVTIQGFISNLTLSSGNVTIGTLSGVDKPPISLRLILNSSNQPWTFGESIYGTIDTDGTITVKPTTTTNTVISFDVTYIAGSTT